MNLYIKKKAIILLSLVVLLVCTGCSLIEKNQSINGENPYKEFSQSDIFSLGYINYFKYEYGKELPDFYDDYEEVYEKCKNYPNNEGHMLFQEMGRWCFKNDFNTNEVYYGDDNFDAQPDGIGLIFRMNMKFGRSFLTFVDPRGNIREGKTAEQIWKEEGKDGEIVYAGNFEDGKFSKYGMTYFRWEQTPFDYLTFQEKNAIGNPIAFEGYYKDGVREGEGIEYVYRDLKLERKNGKPYVKGRLIVLGGNYKAGNKDGDFTVYAQDNNGIGFKWFKAEFDNGKFTGNATVWDAKGNVVSNGPFRSLKDVENAYPLQYAYAQTEGLEKEQEKLNGINTQAENFLKNYNIDCKVISTNFKENASNFLSLVQINNDYKLLLVDNSSKTVATTPFSNALADVLSSNANEVTFDLTIINDEKDPKKNYDYNKGKWNDKDHTIGVYTHWTRESYNDDNLGVRMLLPTLAENRNMLISYQRNIDLVRLFIFNMPSLRNNMARSNVKI